VLSNEKFARTFGFQLEDWQTALAEVMGELREQAQG
jgi:dTDP-4-dehydrorhamnose reductase